MHPPFSEKVSKESKSEPDSVQGNDEETLPEEMTWDDLIALCAAEDEET